MAKKKNNKKTSAGVVSSIGGVFDSYKMAGKRNRSMTPAREAVRREIRDIVSQARQEKDAIKRKVSNAAKSGIKGLKIDGARLMNMLKDIKFKESSTQASVNHYASDDKTDSVKHVHMPKQKDIKIDSYYDIWYYTIETELKNIKKTD